MKDEVLEVYVLTCKHVQGKNKTTGKDYNFYTGEVETVDGSRKEYSSEVELPVNIRKTVLVKLGEPTRLAITAIA